MFKEFKKFILRGNLVDLAVGFTVGASFTTVARSLVDDILMPPLSLVLGKSDFNSMFIVLKTGGTPPPYTTAAQAKELGATTLNYGAFMNSVFTLFIVALSMFVVIRLFSKMESQIQQISGRKDKEKKDEPASKKCPYCLSNIAYRATRCPECTSQLAKVDK